MDLCSIASGSGGNCVFVQSGKSRILVDAGYSGRKIELLLKKAGIDPRSLDAIFVTHEHGDHIAGVGVLSRRFDLPVFANKKTWLAMEKKLGKIKKSNICLFNNEEDFEFLDMQIRPFSIYHDAADPVAFVFKSAGSQISLMTDTGLVDDRMAQHIKGSDIYYLEANHDPDMLRSGPYPIMLKERIMSTFGHLSNVQAADLLGDLLEGRGEEVVLGHLSTENNRPELALYEIRSSIEKKGFIEGKNVFVRVAAPFEPSDIITGSSAANLLA